MRKTVSVFWWFFLFFCLLPFISSCSYPLFLRLEKHMLACSVGSGSVLAFSTPFAVALAEAAACNAITLADEGQTSVGKRLSKRSAYVGGLRSF
jgi:hypothetical protein